VAAVGGRAGQFLEQFDHHVEGDLARAQRRQQRIHTVQVVQPGDADAVLHHRPQRHLVEDAVPQLRQRTAGLQPAEIRGDRGDLFGAGAGRCAQRGQPAAQALLPRVLRPVELFQFVRQVPAVEVGLPAPRRGLQIGARVVQGQRQERIQRGQVRRLQRLPPTAVIRQAGPHLQAGGGRRGEDQLQRAVRQGPVRIAAAAVQPGPLHHDLPAAQALGERHVLLPVLRAQVQVAAPRLDEAAVETRRIRTARQQAQSERRRGQHG
jgi:hypothetical protein